MKLHLYDQVWLESPSNERCGWNTLKSRYMIRFRNKATIDAKALRVKSKSEYKHDK